MKSMCPCCFITRSQYEMIHYKRDVSDISISFDQHSFRNVIFFSFIIIPDCLRLMCYYKTSKRIELFIRRNKLSDFR